MKTVEEDSGYRETQAEGPDLPRLMDSHNTNRTQVGDPLQAHYPHSTLHQTQGQVTGSGTGPRRHYSPGSGDGEIGMWQLVVRNPNTKRASGGIHTQGMDLPDGTIQRPGAVKDLYPETNFGAMNIAHPQMEQRPVYQIGAALPALATQNPLTWAMQQGSLPGALAGGLALGGLGLGGAWLYNKFQNKKNKVNTRNWALAAGLTGLGLGALGGHYRSRYDQGGAIQRDLKQQGWDAYQALPPEAKIPYQEASQTIRAEMPKASSFFDPRADLINSLAASGLPGAVVARLYSAIQSLSSEEAAALKRTVGGLGGFALAQALSSRLGIGGTPRLLAGILGGLTTSSLMGGLFGGRQQTVADLYGRPY